MTNDDGTHSVPYLRFFASGSTQISGGVSSASSSSVSTGIWYAPLNHLPRSRSLHRSEQNGNVLPGLPIMSALTGFLQMGQVNIASES